MPVSQAHIIFPMNISFSSVPVQEPVRMAGPSRCDTLHVSGFEANTTVCGLSGQRDVQATNGWGNVCG